MAGWDDLPPDPDIKSSGGWDSMPPDKDLEAPQWSNLPGNIIPDAQNTVKGIAGLGARTGKGLIDMPGDLITSGATTLAGGDPMQTPIGQDLKTVGSGIAAIPKSFADLASKEAWVNHPVQNAVNAGSLLEGGLEGGLTSEAGTGTAGRLGEVLEKSGAREATGVAGITDKTIGKMTRRGGNEAVTRADLGKRLIDDNVIGGFGETPEKIRDNQLAQKSKYGDQVKNALNQIRNSGVPPEVQAEKALSPILNEWSRLADDSQPEGRAMARRLAASYTKLEDIANRKEGVLGFDDIHNEMESVGEKLGNTPKTSPSYGHLSDLYKTLAQSKDAIVDDVSKRSGNSNLAQQLKEANAGFHTYSQIGKDVGKIAAKEGVEKGSNIGFYGSLWAMAHGEFDKAAEFFVGGRLLGPALKEIAPSMAKHTVQAGRMMQKYGPVLEGAAKKGAKNLAVTSSVIANKDPEYADTLASLGGSFKQ